MTIAKLQDPVIVMGIPQGGTTLLAEMVHRGGVPMYAGEQTPSPGGSVKYERPICQAINRQILGVPRDAPSPHPLKPMWTWNLRPFPCADLDALRAEVGDKPWGFKDPRTTHTYRVWVDVFPRGPRLYCYRHHHWYLRRALRLSGRLDPHQAQRHLRAWLAYSEATIANCGSDAADRRPWALLNCDELTSNPALIRRAEQITGVRLHAPRRLDGCRPSSTPHLRDLPLRDRLYILCAEAGQQTRLRKVYETLEGLRLRA